MEGRNSVGYEINRAYETIIREKLQLDQPTLFGRRDVHVRFVADPKRTPSYL